MTIQEAREVLKQLLKSDSEDGFLLEREREALRLILEEPCSKTSQDVSATGKQSDSPSTTKVK